MMRFGITTRHVRKILANLAVWCVVLCGWAVGTEERVYRVGK